jgi:hypothetical protein
MISSFDYWLSVAIVLMAIPTGLLFRKALRDIKLDRLRTLRWHIEKALGKGDRVVVSLLPRSDQYPVRVRVGIAPQQQVFGFTNPYEFISWVSAISTKNVFIDPRPYGGIPLHHPSLN